MSTNHFISINMKKKICKWRNDENKGEENEKDQQVYERVAKSVADGRFKRSHHERVVSIINEQIKRPETSYALRKDFQELKTLAMCHQQMQSSQEKSMNCCRRISKFNREENSEKFYLSLERQIRRSTVSTKMKKYQGMKLNHFNNSINNFQKTSLNLNELKVQGRQSKQMPSININYKIEQKMNLLGDFSEEQKQSFLKKLNQFLQKQNFDGLQNSQNLRNYLINHYFLQQFMEKSTSDLGMLQLKEENKDIYQRIKSQMIGQLIQQRKFNKFLDNILIYQNKEKTNRKERIRKNSNAFLQGKIKQKDSVKYFQKLYENVALKIDEAFNQFNIKKEEQKKPKTFKRRDFKISF